MFKFILVNIFIFLSLNTFSSSKIYSIRHAKVQIENPGWCNTKVAQTYREQYNINSVEVFDPNVVFEKIDKPETIDTAFCSPQFRAMQTAENLFNKQVILNISENLMELNYTMIQFPLLKLPVRLWQAISLISWMAGNNQNDNPTYKQRKESLEIYSNEIITFAETNGKSIVVGHAILNRELIKLLKKKGWRLENKIGYENLAVNCLVKD